MPGGSWNGSPSIATAVRRSGPEMPWLSTVQLAPVAASRDGAHGAPDLFIFVDWDEPQPWNQVGKREMGIQ